MLRKQRCPRPTQQEPSQLDTGLCAPRCPQAPPVLSMEGRGGPASRNLALREQVALPTTHHPHIPSLGLGMGMQHTQLGRCLGQEQGQAEQEKRVCACVCACMHDLWPQSGCRPWSWQLRLPKARHREDTQTWAPHYPSQPLPHHLGKGVRTSLGPITTAPCPHCQPPSCLGDRVLALQHA